MAFEVGSTIGDYEILELLGSGGMGTVYKVRNVISDRVDAMKVLLPDLRNSPELCDRFVREIKVQASLRHPNIAELYTALRLENRLAMIIELVHGVSLSTKLQDGLIDVRLAAGYASQVLQALQYAHTKGVVHRDIKPANIILQMDGIVKLLDFGIAKAATEHKLTITGSALGSPYYMSPEQVKGQQSDPRTDIYSVGIMLYEMVTGVHPFDGESEFAIMLAHLQMTPAPPHEVAAGLPATLSEVILRAMAKEPTERFQTAAEFRVALESVFPARRPRAPAAATPRPRAPEPQVIETPPPVRREAPPRPASRLARRGLWAAGALVVLGLAGWGVVFQLNRTPTAPPRPAPAAPAPPIAQSPVDKPVPRKTDTPPAPPAPTKRPPPAPVVAEVAIKTEPAGAKARLDETEKSCTTPCALEATQGKHVLRLTLEGHREQRREIQVSGGTLELPAISLIPLAGDVLLQTQPPDASIWIDDKLWPKKTPAQITLPPGKHRVTVEKDGVKASQVIEVLDGDFVRYSASLAR